MRVGSALCREEVRGGFGILVQFSTITSSSSSHPGGAVPLANAAATAAVLLQGGLGEQ